MRALPLLVTALALMPLAVGAQQPDTVRVGQRIRVSASQSGPWQTARFQGVRGDSVILGTSSSFLRSGVARAAVCCVQIGGHSLARGAAKGGAIGAAFGAAGLGVLLLLLYGCGECDGEFDPVLASKIVGVPAVIGAALGLLFRPEVWREGNLPARRVPVREPARTRAGAPRVYLFAGSGETAGASTELRQRLGAVGVAVAGDQTYVDAGGRGPAEVRYYSAGEADAAEALAFWLSRALSRPDLAARYHRDGNVPRGEIHVWLGT